MGRKLVYLFSMLVFAVMAMGQNTIIKGIVTDSITGETLPSVSLILKGTTTGTATDMNGNYSMTTSSKVGTLLVSYLGYTEKEIKINVGRTNNLNIQLAPTSINLGEVVIRAGREKYSRRNNPAVEFVQNVIDSRHSNDPRNQDYFSYNQYEKMIFAMNDFERKPREDGKTGKFDFLIDYVDTLDIGTTILPISEKERFETVYYRKDPKTEKRLVLGSKSAGVDEIFSRDGIQQILNEVFREVNIFQNDIPLFLMRFVSPLSSMGPTFYRYYLLDTLNVNGQQCVDLGFAPFNSESFGFTGHLYVTLDSTYFVQKVLLNVPKKINLNFVDRMTVTQDFKRLSDGTRIMLKDDIQVDFKLTEKTKGMYARRLIVYNNHTFSPPDDIAIFQQSPPVITLNDANRKAEDFWASIRPPEAEKRNANSVEKLMERLRAVPIFYLTEKVVSMFVSGYVQTNADPMRSKFEFGPVNTFVSGNAIEGARFRVGGTTTKFFSNRLFLDGYAAYGTDDRELKYDAIAEYSFIDKTEYRKEFPVHSIRAQYTYDINQIGQQYMYTNKDNIFLALKRQKDTRATYLRNAELTYYREHYNGWGYGAVVRNKKEYATEYAEFNRIEADDMLMPVNSYSMTEMEFRVRFAPNEKFYQTRNYRYPITLDAPVFTLNHITAQKGLLGSSYTYNRTDFGIQKRFWFSAFGYVDIIAKAGKVWDKVPYPLLVLPNANLSYTIQPESYTNMNAMEFISDEYASWDVTYFMNGTLLNRIPLLKKLQWREVVSFRGLYGNLTDKNNPFLPEHREGLYAFPEGSYALGKEPYMEVGVGVENIFKFLRLDYVWRLTYRDNPNIQTSGVRFMMKLSF
ncbi:DUF5686 and carboxypeptidase-like regulatory domain-containing protein [Parabacteroides sp. PF5-9]|uniref:DUF5686 and carboxypeptidase-like regulatory domain-containing protein n=1 Tax=Parabacteroides sp. PF5-9 TaxID=1742404 RepID=UPI002475CA97|nr:DUF5686 and carboxypeptidase-like regulatory domain-containing protein [Parabacteroides sp. PF5-9]MDH6359122.1 hypothetical protein [Parabacteroides sp. PF5-9]